MKTIKLFFMCLSVGMLLFLSCRKDPEVISKTPASNTTTTTAYNPTPYSINVPRRFQQPLLPGNNPMTQEGVALGRFLFYDSILSGNKKLSCGGCHIQKFAFSGGNVQFSKGSDGVTLGTRNAPSLFNLAWDPDGTPPNGGFFWDGRAATIEAQALMPIQNPIEMNNTLTNMVKSLQATANYPVLFQKAFGSSTITSDNVAKAIAQFVRSITSGTSQYDSIQNRQKADFNTADEKLGYLLFVNDPDTGLRNTGVRRPMKSYKDQVNGISSGLDCFHCHGGPLFTPVGVNRLVNNGLVDNDSVFKVPSLRNVALTAPYMHDGRFATLDAVFANYDHGYLPMHSQHLSGFMFYPRYANKFKMNLQPNEILALKAFLATLTDYSMTTNPAYSNPFRK